MVLGENWLEVGDFIGILAFLMIPFVTQSVFYMLYDLIGKTKNSIWNDIYGLSAIVISFLLFKPSTLIEFAGLRVIVGVSSFIVILTLAKFFLPVSLRKIGLVLAIPLVSSLVTLFTVLYLKRVWEIEVPSLALIFYGGLALVLYALVFSVILRLIRGGAAVFILRLLPELVFNWLKKLKVL